MLFNVRNISKLSDEELLTHYIKSGDTEYFGELYNRYIPLTYGLCLKYLQDEDQAQEAVMQQIALLVGTDAERVARTIVANARDRPDTGSIAGWWSLGLLFVAGLALGSALAVLGIVWTHVRR